MLVLVAGSFNAEADHNSHLTLFSFCSYASGMIYYVALPFVDVDGGLAPGQARECAHGGEAIRRAEAMSRDPFNAGAVAFSRKGDPNIGEFDDAVVLKAFGRVPEDFVGSS